MQYTRFVCTPHRTDMRLSTINSSETDSTSLVHQYESVIDLVVFYSLRLPQAQALCRAVQPLSWSADSGLHRLERSSFTIGPCPACAAAARGVTPCVHFSVANHKSTAHERLSRTIVIIQHNASHQHRTSSTGRQHDLTSTANQVSGWSWHL